MGKYVLGRIASALVVMLLVSILTFLVLDLIPGNAAIVAVGVEGSAETLARLEAGLGLDRSLPQRIADYYRGLVSLDLGTSSYYAQDVWSLIRQRLGVTIPLALLSTAISFSCALVLGSLAAYRRGGLLDGICRTIVQLAGSIPSFWLSLLLLILFSSVFSVAGIGDYVPPSVSIRGYVTAVFLPVIVLAVGQLGPMLRLVRSSMITSLGEDWYASARVKGLGRGRLIFVYALRHAISGPLTLCGNQLAKLLGGTAIVESIFSLPGLGRLFLTAVEMRDLQLVQGIVIFITALVVLMNLVFDILVHLVNPAADSREAGGA